MQRLTRRSLLVGAAAFAGAAAFEVPSVIRQARSVSSRKVLVIASSNDITNFDPHAGTDEPTTTILRNTYDALVTVQDDPARIVPQLAQSWSVSQSGTEYEFKLNPKARFHDGTPVTADSVVYSFERVLRLRKGNEWMIHGIIAPGGVNAVDQGTVSISLAKPFGPLLQVLPWIWVVNRKLVEAHAGGDDGQSYLRNTLAGSGSFSMRRAEPGNLYELARRKDDWKAGGGNTASVIYKIVRESANQRLMIQRGDTHVALNLTNEDVTAVNGRKHINMVIKPEFRTFMFRMNTQHGPLSDRNARRALMYATNHQSMMDATSYSSPAVGPLPRGMFGFDPTLTMHPTNIDQARRLLAQSSSRNQDVKLVVAYISGYEQQRRWCMVLYDSLKQIGIQLEIRAMTWPDLVASARSPQTCPDLFSMYTAVNYADPADVSFNYYHSSRIGNWSNPTYSNRQVDGLIEAGRVETDLDRRKEIYLAFQKEVLTDCPDLYVATDDRKLAFRDDVHNFVYSPIRPAAFNLFPLSLS
jgi:peptide/nickel transport system substrate-binding protein